MSDRVIHNPASFLKDLAELESYLHRLLKLLDEMEVSLYQSRQVYLALQSTCQRVQKG